MGLARGSSVGACRRAVIDLLDFAAAYIHRAAVLVTRADGKDVAGDSAPCLVKT